MQSKAIDPVSLPAKLIRPRPHGLFPRTRLYERLDAASACRILWLAAPAGAGKTVLTSGYLETRGLPHLWYQVDKGDGDPANFFHYLGLAAREFAPSLPMPVLTPEYLPDIGLFARRFFEQLYQRLTPPTVLVLDDFQTVPAASLLHEIVRDGAALLPPGLRLIVLSRAEPPSAFARLRLHGELTMLGFDELRLTLDETRGLAEMRTAPTMAADFIERCHVRAQGWAAGLVLLLEQARLKPCGDFRLGESAMELLFDYFVAEIFGELPAAIRTVLLETSVLPKMQLSWVENLTGNAEAGRVLADLHRRGFFVLRREEEEAVFEYHPLFRDFLRTEARKTLGAPAFAECLRRAAGVLAAAGQAEEAVPLCLEAGDFDTLRGLLPLLAPRLLTQGRHQTLAQYLTAVPEEVSRDDGWLPYWLGLALQPCDLAEARRCLESAYATFERADDAAGLYLAWAEIVNHYILEWRDFSGLDRWIDTYEHLRRRHPVWPSVEVEVQAYCVATAFHYRRPRHPDLPVWAGRAGALLESGASGRLSLPLAGSLLQYHVWSGHLTRAAPIVERLNALVTTPEAPPLAFIVSRVQIAMFHYARGEASAGLACVREGLERAGASGLHAFDLLLHSHGVYAGLIGNDLRSAGEFLDKARAEFERRPSDGAHLDIAHYHHVAGLLAQRRGATAEAVDHFRASLRISLQSGTLSNRPITLACLASSLFRLGRAAEATEHLAAAQRLAAEMNSALLEYVCLMTEARMALEREGKAGVREALARMLALSREAGGLVICWEGLEAEARLYAAALRADIEVPYVQGLIRRLDLAPPDPLEAPAHWPWPVAIHALGRFEILKHGQPLRFAGKAQQKPLELLMALLAHGGAEVPWTRLADDLWPDAEGDAGYRALVTTVQRLRKLLECPEAVRFGEGAVSLDPRRVRVDAWCFGQLAQRTGPALDAPEGQALTEIGERIAALYRGPFLERVEAPWTIAHRERLRVRHAGLVRDLGRTLEKLGREREAADLYEKNIEADPSVEVFHQYLIHLRLRQGRITEARAAYEHCRRIFAVRFGASPSRETEQLIRATRLSPTPPLPSSLPADENRE